jgi:hypothetical protein
LVVFIWGRGAKVYRKLKKNYPIDYKYP